jgi:hypothetical protein
MGLSTLPKRSEDLAEVINNIPELTRTAVGRVLDAVGTEADTDTRDVLIARLLNALADLVTALRDAPLSEILVAPSDRETLVRALEAAPLDNRSKSELEAEILLQEARLRGVLARDRLLQAEGGALPADKAAGFLRSTRQTVNNRRQKGTLLGLRAGKRGYVYPAWQFTEAGTLPGLEVVLAELADREAWTQLAFMLNPNSRLHGQTPLSELRRGHVEPVVKAARAYGRHGAS